MLLEVPSGGHSKYTGTVPGCPISEPSPTVTELDLRENRGWCWSLPLWHADRRGRGQEGRDFKGSPTPGENEMRAACSERAPGTASIPGESLVSALDREWKAHLWLPRLPPGCSAQPRAPAPPRPLHPVLRGPHQSPGFSNLPVPQLILKFILQRVDTVPGSGAGTGTPRDVIISGEVHGHVERGRWLDLQKKARKRKMG